MMPHMMPPNAIWAAPSESSWAQNGTPERPSSDKKLRAHIRHSPIVAFLKLTFLLNRLRLSFLFIFCGLMSIEWAAVSRRMASARNNKIITITSDTKRNVWKANKWNAYYLFRTHVFLLVACQMWGLILFSDRVEK